MATLSDTIPGVMALAGVTLMLIILLRKYFRHTGRLKRASRRESKPRYASAAAAQRKKLEMPAEVRQWQVEFHETCRDLKAEIDSKMRALQILIVEANAAAERLEKAREE